MGIRRAEKGHVADNRRCVGSAFTRAHAGSPGKAARIRAFLRPAGKRNALEIPHHIFPTFPFMRLFWRLRFPAPRPCPMQKRCRPCEQTSLHKRPAQERGRRAPPHHFRRKNAATVRINLAHRTRRRNIPTDAREQKLIARRIGAEALLPMRTTSLHKRARRRNIPTGARESPPRAAPGAGTRPPCAPAPFPAQKRCHRANKPCAPHPAQKHCRRAPRAHTKIPPRTRPGGKSQRHARYFLIQLPLAARATRPCCCAYSSARENSDDTDDANRV